MIRFSVCLETIFNALPLEGRIEQAAACGAAAVEFWTWRDKDLDAIAHAKEAVGVDVAAFVGLSDSSANDPASADLAVAELLIAGETARQIGAANIIVRPGREVEGLARATQLETLAEVVATAAPSLARHHVGLLVEPVNARIDHPGTLLVRTTDAVALVERIGEPNVRMLFDVYDQFVTEGCVLASIESHADQIGHFHLADAPGHGEPGTGALDFKELFKTIESIDYDGYVGLEFFPSGDHAEAVRHAVELGGHR